jgi:polar amino acid transport system substrate-binding protein
MKTLRLIFTVFVATLFLFIGTGSASAEGLFEQIKKRGRVVVATEAAYYPFEFVENGKIVGYNKEVLDLIVAAWGVELEQLDLPFAGILPGLLQNKYDFVATSLFMTPERASRYAFTMPLAEVKVGLLKRSNDTRAIAVDDLTGLTIGSMVPVGATTQVFEKYNTELKAKGKEAAGIKYFQAAPEIFLALGNEQVDLMVDGIPSLLGGMKAAPGRFEIVGNFGDPVWIGWVTRLEDTDLRDALNVEIKKLRDSGELAKLQTKWLHHDIAGRGLFA